MCPNISRSLIRNYGSKLKQFKVIQYEHFLLWQFWLDNNCRFSTFCTQRSNPSLNWSLSLNGSNGRRSYLWGNGRNLKIFNLNIFDSKWQWKTLMTLLWSHWPLGCRPPWISGHNSLADPRAATDQFTSYATHSDFYILESVDKTDISKPTA